MFKKFILVITLVIALCSTASGAPATVKVRLDSATMLMGTLNMMRVELVQDAGVNGAFPLLKAAMQNGFAGVCGDSVEMRLPVKQDTVELGSGRIQVNMDIPVQAFDSGYFKLPALEYVCGLDTARSNMLTLKVVPVKVTADAEISPYASVVPPAGGSIFDYLPDWIVDWWWLILSILILIGLGIYIIVKKRGNKTLPLMKPKPLPTPWSVAIGQLEALKSLKLWESGREKEYFTRLTDILRDYLDRRFGINAMEMTSRQIMDTMRSNEQAREKRDYIREVLDIADFVKFAKVRPLPDDNTKAYSNAVEFVKSTEISDPAEKTQFMEGYTAREEDRRQREEDSLRQQKISRRQRRGISKKTAYAKTGAASKRKASKRKERAK